MILCPGPCTRKMPNQRCQMSSIADPVAGASLTDSKAAAGDTKAAAVSAPAITLPVTGERELRLDLFRGMALWLVFVDHLPAHIPTWFTIPHYRFSAATEIFIIIPGYTPGFASGRATLAPRFLVARAPV